MAEGKWQAVCRIVHRKRPFESERAEGNSLRRCLNCWDLTALGVGSTLGIGVYVLVGAVAMKVAGPSIILSFLIAALTSLFAGLCYAEFGARVPLAGSAYIYTYVSVGELVAFVVGWNNMLEYVFGSATVARGMSSYVDLMTNHSMSEWFDKTMPITVPLLATYFDLFAFFFVIATGTLLALGVRESSSVNNVLSSLNVLVILFAIIAGSFKADPSNWSIPAEQVPSGYGVGGFFPYGVWGTLKGAAICFYGFVGFDVVNASGEEVKNPRKTIPTAILAILFIVFLAYMGVCIVVTMMVPYYEMSPVASVSTAFGSVGWDWARWIISIGAIIGICTSLFGSIFALPRLLYSMASDGLFIHWFAIVSAKNRSPIIATVVPSFIIAILSGILELEQLVLMMCIGTLSSYTIVAACVVLLRYRSDFEPNIKATFMRQILGRGDKNPTKRSNLIICIAMALYICLCITTAIVTVYTSRPLAVVIILHLIAAIIVIIMALQPTIKEDLIFKTPLVPFLPCLSIYFNIYLMVIIEWHTWLRILVWILIGIPIYFICICCYTQIASRTDSENNLKKLQLNKNGKQVPVQIIVESPTPPNTITRTNDFQNDHNTIDVMPSDVQTKPEDLNKAERVHLEMQIENNEEKEAKIIDLLDQVLQAEEDAYGEIISLKENIEEDAKPNEQSNESGIPHRKSLSELSDAGSEASLGNQELSKYDVIAQVHREDLPRVSEEDEERYDHLENLLNIEDEDITVFNESDTNSRTDESGYSDTIDKPNFSESLEDTNNSNIPVPPPFDENYFKMGPIPLNIKQHDIVPLRHSKKDQSFEDTIGPNPSIPVPPPFDENYFKTTPIPIFKKYNTISARHSKGDLETEDSDNNEPRSSLQSSNSQGDGNIRFGSSRQIKFMSKLNDIFQKTLDNEDDEPEERKRSHSTGNVTEISELTEISRERPQLFLDLKKELLARESLPSLRPVNTEEDKNVAESAVVDSKNEDEEASMSRQDLKSKLENIFAGGGPQMLAKPRLMKSNPPTPEDSYQTDLSSTESIPKLPKMERNDTLKRQKEKFGLVLNSIRLSVNKDDEVL